MADGTVAEATFALALIHHPVLNRRGEVGTTSVVNADVHDFARLGRTYGALRCYIVTPLLAQQELVAQIIHHWTGYGAIFNPFRAEALDLVSVVGDFASCREDLTQRAACRPFVCVTGARLKDRIIPYQDMRTLIKQRNKSPFLFVFGTGWGLSEELIMQADYRLPPIVGHDAYNHLSVRCAAAIILDRLLARMDDNRNS